MKTTKKGFTLIELIVVIAIIGVLAAILVPTMLGYVRKSKLSSAGTTASSIYKAINSTLTELDEEGWEIGGNYTLEWNTTGTTPGWTGIGSIMGADGTTAMTGAKTDLFHQKVSNFFADIEKVKNAKAAVLNGSCIAVASCSDKTYTGTYPSGVITNDNYDDTAYEPAASGNTVTVNENALIEAMVKAGVKRDSITAGMGDADKWVRG